MRLCGTYSSANTNCKRQVESGFQDRAKEMEAKRKKKKWCMTDDKCLEARNRIFMKTHYVID